MFTRGTIGFDTLPDLQVSGLQDGHSKTIVVTQPRRLAAITVAITQRCTPGGCYSGTSLEKKMGSY